MHGPLSLEGAIVEPGEVRDAVLSWFATDGRSLPGREVRDPWRVLVLEVMSQQTQIERSLEAAAAFCGRFPTPEALAGATAGDAIRAWAGLGYNRRALALRGAARRIVDRHAGAVPASIESLEDLPGVGPYTARAVAARAFGAPVMPVDVNVRRVLGRVLGSSNRDGPAAGRAREMQAFADAVAAAVPASAGPAAAGPSDPGTVADAVMDLAAAVCRPRRPDCRSCPLSARCHWRASSPEEAAPSEAGSAGRSAARSASGGPASHSGSVPFAATRRWLRGQLLRELRDVPGSAWLALEGDRGPHSHVAVREALAALESEGFVELDEQGRARLCDS